jgi:SAM-dependent methyltransferase
MKILDKMTRAQDGRGKVARIDKIERSPYFLYQIAVQSPEHDVQFLDRAYKKKNGRLPKLLREDFCGTAYLSCHWVRTRDENRAVAVDHDPVILEWGRRHNVSSLGGQSSRVKLVRGDVRGVSDPKPDVVAALNYSYFVFKDRRHLAGYFRSVRGALEKGGIFVLDIFGGWETQMAVRDETPREGFTYVWEQVDFDALTNRTKYRIHFEFDKGPPIKNAFSYDWRLWGIPEVRDALAEVGFSSVEVYWEGIDPDTGEGDGVYRRVTKAKSSPGWTAIIVAS